MLKDENAHGRVQGDPDAWYLLGVTQFRLGDFKAAESAFRTSLSLDGRRASAVYYIGLSLERQGRTDEALTAYRHALSIDPNLAKARDKVRTLSGGRDTTHEAPHAAVPTVRPAARDSELILPETDAEFEEYERRIRRKSRIDTQADYDAQISGLPWWTKLLIAIVAIFILVVFISILIDGASM
jgi:tetratricopeptide (TPR) repeat protein